MSQTTYKTMDVSDLGDNCTEADLDLFRQICESRQARSGESDAEVTEHCWGNGDWHGLAVKEIGEHIGKAMARDVLADSLPREWTGLDPQDRDQIPYGLGRDEVERIAREVYEHEIAGK